MVAGNKNVQMFLQNMGIIAQLFLCLNFVPLWSSPHTHENKKIKSYNEKCGTSITTHKCRRWKMADQKLFVEKLNKALEWEYAAVIQYVQHAAVLTGAQYDAISKELVVHANEELDHAVKVAELIKDFDGVPTINTEKREISPDGKKMLEQDLAGEQIAIDAYKELVQIANELKEFGAAQVLEEILAKEEEHKRDLLGALGR